MILRAWSAEASAGNVDAYIRHFHQVVLPELADIPGHAGAYLLDVMTARRSRSWCLLSGNRWTPSRSLRATPWTGQ